MGDASWGDAVPEVGFRPLRRSDFERLRSWLNQPHVYEWWGTESGPDGLGGPGPHAAIGADMIVVTVARRRARADAEPGLAVAAQVAEEYGPAADGVDPTSRFVILVDGVPAGLIQWYRLCDSPEYGAAIGEPTGAGVDLLLGDPGRVGRGIGPLVIDRFLVEVVFAQPGVRRCVAGPDVRNVRSIRAFTKAGFEGVRDALVSGEPAPEHVMVRIASEPALGP